MVVCPASGASHNQLAVIALADANHVRTTYHLYRALCAQEPHPSARGNLEIEFRKIMSLWAKGELTRSEDTGIPGMSLCPWFVYLHAQCYKGTDFPEHDELESEFLSQLAVDLRERSLDGTLQKFCLINIAAEEFARKRSNGKFLAFRHMKRSICSSQLSEESVFNACLFFQRINVKTFFTLLQILLVELERSAVEDSDNKDAKSKPDKVTIVARRILPALRHYSSWLLTVSPLLVAYKEEKDTPLSVQIAEFWKIYANTLTLLALTFEVVNLPDIDYLLEEDEETLGFAPLDQEATSRRYMDTDRKRKPRMHDEGAERSHPNIEMLYRIREFVIDGLDLVVGNVRDVPHCQQTCSLTQRQKIPIALVDDNDKKTFIYKEEGLPSEFFSSPSGQHPTLSSTSIERDDIQRAVQDPSHAADSRSVFGSSQSASMSANMHRIVEDVEKLVESDSYENAPNVADEPPFPSSSQLPTPTAFRDEPMIPRNTPIAPPGLGPPIGHNAAAMARTPSSHAYTPLIPNLSSIWNTGLPSGGGDLSALGTPRAPPGLEQQSNPIFQGSITSSNLRPSQDHQSSSSSSSIARDLLRQQQHQLMMTRNQHAAVNPLNASPPMRSPSSPWTSSSPQRTTSAGLDWENSNININSPPPSAAPPSSFGIPPVSGHHQPISMPMSSNLPYASWANDAFIGSHTQLPPSSPMPGYQGFSSTPPGLSGRSRSGAQLGAIGETPPCGQGG